MIVIYIKIFIDVVVCIEALYIQIKLLRKEKVRSSSVTLVMTVTCAFLFLSTQQIINIYYVSLYFTYSALIFLILIPFVPKLVSSFLKEKTFENFSKLSIYIFIILFFIIYFLLYCIDIDTITSDYYFKILCKFHYFDFIFLFPYFIFMYLLKDLFDFKTVKEKLYGFIPIFILTYFFRLAFIIIIIPVLI